MSTYTQAEYSTAACIAMDLYDGTGDGSVHDAAEKAHKMAHMRQTSNPSFKKAAHLAGNWLHLVAMGKESIASISERK